VDVGANAVILGAITIGDGAVIGAGAVVLKDVPARAVVAGNPARVISQR
jgi:acetyltransferase-like isoleucine patch superfamily enzyme